MLLLDIKIAMSPPIVKAPLNPADKMHKQLDHIERDLGRIQGGIDAIEPGDGVKLSLLETYEERINRLKMQFFHAFQGILILDDADGELADHESSLREEIYLAYECPCDLFNSIPKDISDLLDPPKEEKKVDTGIKLPKFSIPTFNGGILN